MIFSMLVGLPNKRLHPSLQHVIIYTIIQIQFLSVKSIVIPPANTGKDNNNKKAVIKIDHTNNGSLSIVIPGSALMRHKTLN